MRLLVLVVSVAVLVGCAAPAHAPGPRGKVVFSIRLTKGAFTGVPKGNTGVFFYEDDRLITCYRMRDGDVIEVAGGGSDSTSALRGGLERIHFEAFDFEAELKTAAQRLEEKAKHDGTSILHLATLDGAEYEITYDFGRVSFRIQKWNPIPEIDYYAPHSEKLAKLKAVIDLFALNYGRSKLVL